MGKHHFQSLFKDTKGTSIAKIVRIAQFFPIFVIEEDNLHIMEEVSKRNSRRFYRTSKVTKVWDRMVGQ
jgi:hypothetical protein